MPLNPNICAYCGQRPSSVRVFVSQGGGEGTTLNLCPPCAQRLAMESQAAMGGRSPFGPGPAGPGHAQPDENTSKTPALDEFGRDLTAEAAAGRIDPVIGRAAEVEQTGEILARRGKNNPLLHGEPGGGR